MGIMAELPRVALGERHTCEIRNGGEVWCFGSNHYGQLGDGSSRDSVKAVRSQGISDAVGVWAGRYNSFAVTSTGALYVWGCNDYGELGLGKDSSPALPTAVPDIGGVKKVAPGTSRSHTIILLDDGTVRVAGNVGHTGARIGSSRSFGEPVMGGDTPVFADVKDIANGGESTFLINGDGTVWGVGNRARNALNDYAYNSDNYQTAWQRIVTRNDVEQLWGRHQGGVYKTAGGDYYGWGCDMSGQLGLDGGATGRKLSALPRYTDIKSLAFGHSHAIMLKNDGTVWANGRGLEGQLGVRTARSGCLPTRVSIDGVVREVFAGHYSSSVTTSKGRYAWGFNDYGNLGVKDGGRHNIPQIVVR